MAVESKRGCGYRKIGGLYLVSDGEGVGYDRLPIALDVCLAIGRFPSAITEIELYQEFLRLFPD